MTTTDISGNGKGYDPNSDYGFSFNGTSSSTPLVAGAIALILSIDKSLSINQVLELLEKNSDDLGKQNHDIYYGYGRLNLLKLLNAVIKKP